jgi:hypothetical protein
VSLEDELVLRALGPVPSADTLGALAARGPDWDRVAALALEHCVGTLVTGALRRARVEPGHAARERLANDERAGARWGLALAAETGNVVRVLAGAEVEALPLKGVALGVTAYGDPSVRRSGDVDVLVRPADLERAGAALAAAGYADLMRLDAYERRWFTRSVHQLPPVARPGGPKVEVHTAVHPPLLALELDVDDLLARARPVALPAGPVAAMTPEDSLLVVVSHALRGGWNRLEWVACVAWLAAREDLDWALTERLARRAGAARMLALGLVLARDSLAFELPPPAARLAERDRAAGRLAARLRAEPFWAMPSLDEDHADLRIRKLHLRSRERIRDRARYVRVALLSPTLAEAGRLRLPAPLRWLHVPARWARVARRGARAAAR